MKVRAQIGMVLNLDNASVAIPVQSLVRMYGLAEKVLNTLGLTT